MVREEPVPLTDTLYTGDKSVMKKVKNTIIFFLFTYPIGIVIGVIFWLLRFFRVLKVRGWENFPHWKQKVLVVSNHPSLIEPVLLIGLFFHQYALRPFKYGPWTLADRKNYYDKYPLLRPRLIPIDRLERRGNPESLSEAKNILDQGGNIIIFPEGGRTFKGLIFRYSQNGKRMRVLKRGFARLATETDAILLPLWFEGNFRSGMTLVIGKPLTFAHHPRQEVLEKTEAVLLHLADVAG